MLETITMKFDRNRDKGRDLDRDHKRYMQNEWDLGEEEEE